MTSDAKAEVSLIRDLKEDSYFRVILKLGTHVLHSEKLNLETAFSFACKIKEHNLILKDFWMN